jgi:hypothetical protein
MAQHAASLPLVHETSEPVVVRSESAHGFFFTTLVAVIATWVIAIALAVKF